VIIERIIKAAMEHFGITEEQVETAKEIIDMIEFKEVNGKRVAYITVGEGLDVKIVQPNKKFSEVPSTYHSEKLDKLLSKE
jgi:hypothetical protein